MRGAAQEAGSAAGREVVVLAALIVSGALSGLRRNSDDVWLVVSLVVAALALATLVVMLLRAQVPQLGIRLGRRARLAESRAVQLERRLEEEERKALGLRTEIAARDRAERELRALALQMQERAQDAHEALQTREADLLTYAFYAQIRHEIAITVIDELSVPSEVDPDRLLEGILHTARSALCQERSAGTRLIVLEDERQGRRLRHSAGVHDRKSWDTEKPLAEIARSLADSSFASCGPSAGEVAERARQRITPTSPSPSSGRRSSR